MLASKDAVRDAVEAYREVGVDELILVGTIADPGQVRSRWPKLRCEAPRSRRLRSRIEPAAGL